MSLEYDTFGSSRSLGNITESIDVMNFVVVFENYHPISCIRGMVKIARSRSLVKMSANYSFVSMGIILIEPFATKDLK